MPDFPTRQQALDLAVTHARRASDQLPSMAPVTPEAAAAIAASAHVARAWAAIAGALEPLEVEVLVDVTDEVTLQRPEGALTRRLREVREAREGSDDRG
jgi:hypothetical protein